MKKLTAILIAVLLLMPFRGDLSAQNLAEAIVEVSPQAPSMVLSRVIPGYRHSKLPGYFENVGENKILRGEKLVPFFEKLDADSCAVRIVHIGDSHIRSHMFTPAAKSLLESAFGADAVEPDSISYKTSAIARETGRPGIVYHTFGENGAVVSKFSDSTHFALIDSLAPDLLIVSFGTNECHTLKNYSSSFHYTTLTEFIEQAQARYPQCLIMLTTPPGAYLRVARGRYTINRHTPASVATILKVAERYNLPVWDLYNIAGGEKSACANWMKGEYFRPDKIHFIPEGYVVQGELLATAILKAYERFR